MKRLLPAVALAAFGLVGSLVSANAAILLTQGGISGGTAGIVSALGAVTYDFDTTAAPLTANPGTVLYATNSSSNSAAPFGDSTLYAAVGATGVTQSATLSLGTGVNYLGFYWGSVDSYNLLQLFNGGTLLASYTGNDILDPANGYQGDTGSAFVNFTVFGSPMITSAVFTSTAKSFEFDNITTAVPEPSTWAMMILGFAGLGFLGYRRRATGANFRVV